MKKQHFKIRLLPVIVFTAVIFLLLRAHSYSMPLSSWADISIEDDTVLWDVFCYVKSSAIFIVSIWAALTLIYLLITGQLKIKKSKIYIPMAVYTLAVLISYLMSDFRFMAWTGGVDRFEGTRTILCYMFMLFYTINVVDDIRDGITVVVATIAGVMLACLVGLTQLFGFDFYLTGLGKSIVSGGQGIEIAGEFEPGQVYQSVYNMNYVGMYLSLIVPVIIMFVIYILDKKNQNFILQKGIDEKKRNTGVFISEVLLIMIAFNMYGAGSLGGIIGIAGAIVVLLIFILNKKWQRIAVAALSGVCILVTVAVIYNGEDDSHKQIDYFVTGQNTISISIDGNELNINYDRDNDAYSLSDGEGNYVPVFWFAGEEGVYQVDNDRYSGKISISPFVNEGEQYVVLDVKDEQFLFGFFDDGAKFINPFGRTVSLDKVESIGFEGHLSAGSGRGYIWSRTIPLLKKYLFVGSGADTYMLVFPQNDYAGKYSAGTNKSVVNDKAHNLYLGMAVCTGGISCIAFIAFIIMFIMSVIRSQKRDPLSVAIAAGIIGFLLAGLFNDSSVCIMPMFYGFLGIGIALNIPQVNAG